MHEQIPHSCMAVWHETAHMLAMESLLACQVSMQEVTNFDKLLLAYHALHRAIEVHEILTEAYLELEAGQTSTATNEED